MKISIKYNNSYLMVLAAFLFFSGCSAPVQKSQEFAEEEITDTAAIIREKLFELSVDSLNDENKKAFIQRALQKIKDFTDYIELLSDTSVVETFRKHAREMALNLFSSGKNKIEIPLQNNSEKETLTVRNFINTIESGDYGKMRIEILNVSPDNKIIKENNKIYHGIISAYAAIIKEQTNNINWSVKFKIKRINKNFGDDTKEVWEVFLDDISVINIGDSIPRLNY